MTTLVLQIPTDVRWDEAATKQFAENAPYYLDGSLVVAIADRAITLEVPHEARAADLQTKVESLARTISRTLRDTQETVLFEHTHAANEQESDPLTDLLDNGFLIQTGRGRFVYQGMLLELLNALDIFVASHARDSGAEFQLYPTTVAADTLIRSGYLKAFPHHGFFVAPAACNAESLASLMQCREASDLDPRPDVNLFGPHHEVLAPTVCYHCMESLRGRTVLTPRRFSAMNTCHRFEVLAQSSLDRLQTFRMRELIGFGSEDEVKQMLDASLHWTSSWLQRWGVGHRVTTATDPFFAGAVGNKLYFQSTFALKREIRLRLAFSNRWLSVASYNNHQQSLTKSFGIRSDSDTALSSGCVGWGYERLAYALLARFGTDLAHWPDEPRRDLRLS